MNEGEVLCHPFVTPRNGIHPYVDFTIALAGGTLLIVNGADQRDTTDQVILGIFEQDAGGMSIQEITRRMKSSAKT